MSRRSFDPYRQNNNIIDIRTRKPAKGDIPVMCRQIRAARERKGLNQKEFASMLGITGNSISNWEAGRARPDIYLIPDICRILEVSLYYLFDMEDPDYAITDEDKKHLEVYRGLEDTQREAVDQLMRTFR